jgi:hypothetical protein
MSYDVQGIAPYMVYCPTAPDNELLFVIVGGVRDTPFLQFYGEPYLYKDYSGWDVRRPDEEAFKIMARQSRNNPHVGLCSMLEEKIRKIASSYLNSSKQVCQIDAEFDFTHTH